LWIKCKKEAQWVVLWMKVDSLGSVFLWWSFQLWTFVFYIFSGIDVRIFNFYVFQGDREERRRKQRSFWDFWKMVQNLFGTWSIVSSGGVRKNFFCFFHIQWFNFSYNLGEKFESEIDIKRETLWIFKTNDWKYSFDTAKYFLQRDSCFRNAIW